MTDDDAEGSSVLAAVVLSGGRGSRLGGVSKANLALGVDGVTLLDGVLDALAAAGVPTDLTVVVGDGPERARAGLHLTREAPPFGGPLAALGAGLSLVPASVPEVLVLACDLPAARELVPRLTTPDTGHGGAFGTVMIDAEGRTQWLAGRYRRAPLTAAVEQARAERGTLEGAPLRAALGRLALAGLEDSGGTSRDIDTPADVAREHQLARERELAKDRTRARDEPRRGSP